MLIPTTEIIIFYTSVAFRNDHSAVLRPKLKIFSKAVNMTSGVGPRSYYYRDRPTYAEVQIENQTAGYIMQCRPSPTP
jgi:hypothetical protein